MGNLLNPLRGRMLRAAYDSGEGHIPSSLSILDILWCLYDQVLRIDPFDQQRDIFILSKGHASLALYSVLAEKGLIDLSALANFGKFNSELGGHPDRNKITFVEASTGSLGHGLPIAIGMALAKRAQNLSGNVYVLIGDGECNEGTIWESALLAAHHRLNNLCCIVDFNHSTDRALNVGSLVKKFEAFDWDVCEINGHDHSQITSALNQLQNKSKPMCIVANTIKGKGLARMENNPEWHHKTPNENELTELLQELGV